MVSFDQKLSYLIRELFQRTRNRRISWNSAPGQDSFLAVFNRNGVKIRKHGSGEITLSIIDDDGDTVETWRLTELNSGDAQNLAQMFVLARRSAYKIEESLDNLLQEVQRI